MLPFAVVFGAGLAGRWEAALAGLARVAEAARGLGWPAALSLGVAGLFLAVLADRFRRISGAAGAAVAGALCGLVLRGPMQGWLYLEAWAAAGAGAVLAAAAAFLAPAVFPAVAGALAGGLAGSLAPVGGDFAWGALVGAAVGAGLSLVFARGLAAFHASFLGGLALAVAAVAGGAGRPWAADLAAAPVALVALGLVVAVAGTAFQLGGGPVGPKPGAGIKPAARK